MESRKYTDEDLYLMIAVVAHYPQGGHGGETFWNSMINLYKDKIKFFNEKSAGSLRDKWRKIQKEVMVDITL